MLFQVFPSVLKLHCYWFKRPLLWFLLVLYSQIPLLLNLIFTKFDKHANLLHYRESERKDPVGLEPHGIRLFYSLLIVLAKNKRENPSNSISLFLWIHWKLCDWSEGFVYLWCKWKGKHYRSYPVDKKLTCLEQTFTPFERDA